MTLKTERGDVDTRLGKDGMQREYLILSDEERAKGFVRPVRLSYTHVGIPGPKHPLLDLTAEQAEQYKGVGYVKYEAYPQPADSLGRYWKQDQLDAIDKGCGGSTKMDQKIAETYARDPTFYGATFCATCGKHLPVGETGEFVCTDSKKRIIAALGRWLGDIIVSE